MFTQFFGNYLLSKELVTTQQLSEALELKSKTRLRLGVLAINAGYMTSEQVLEVNRIQATMDKRIGDIAVDKGYLTNQQVIELLNAQKTGYLLLGQALVDLGYLGTEQLESALKSYKEMNKIHNDSLSSEKEEKFSEIVSDFYSFDDVRNASYYIDYTSLLLKNLIRFIGDDFIPLNAVQADRVVGRYVVSQDIQGEFSASTFMECDEKTYIEFSSRFSNENLCVVDDYTDACCGEFLNLHNGLFIVNMSNGRNIELNLEPQISHTNTNIDTGAKACIVPICFTFGTVNFIISSK